MNKLLLKALVCSLFLTTLAKGQSSISLTVEDMPKIETGYISKGLFPPVPININQTGENQNWDFSALIPDDIDPDTTFYFAPSRTPYAADFPNSNVAEGDISEGEFIYYSFTPNKADIVGMVIPLNIAGPVKSKFTPNVTYFPFPFTYGSRNRSSGTSVYKVDNTDPNSENIIDSIRVTNTLTISDTADGWGTIKTPVATYNALRVKLHIRLLSIVEVKAVGTGVWSRSGDPVIEYSRSTEWYAKNIGEPVFSIDFADSVGTEIRFVSWLQGTTTSPITSLQKNNLEALTKINPNPNEGSFQVEFPKEINLNQIHVTDAAGKAVDVEFNPLSGKMNLRDVSNGIYFLNINYDDRIISKKILINK